MSRLRVADGSFQIGSDVQAHMASPGFFGEIPVRREHVAQDVVEATGVLLNYAHITTDERVPPFGGNELLEANPYVGANRVTVDAGPNAVEVEAQRLAERQEAGHRSGRLPRDPFLALAVQQDNS